jgi:NAD(P)-dependent dehydrogenase (short-subunit alcohol dehydrogenase family)
MADIFDLRERIIVVTGGRGLLGSHFTRALIERGARVAVVDLGRVLSKEPNRLKDVAESDRFLYVEADVTKRTDLEAALKAIRSKWGTPFGLINNAAIDTAPDAPADTNCPFEDFPEAVFDVVMDVNVKGVVLCCQVFGREMAEAGIGSIVNIASIYGMVSPDQAIYQFRRDDGEQFYKPIAYSISKSSLYNLTRYLAAYWGPRHIRVNTVTFGGVYNFQDARFVEKYVAKVPLGRMADPSDCVGPIVFLMSDAAQYITGANIVVDGGYISL